jgi:uncharacterized protein with von Willebrand factor type A (vWA) domain
MARYVYTAWESPEETTALSPEALLNALSNDFLQHGDLDAALRALQRRGDSAPGEVHVLPGAPDLLQPLAQYTRPIVQDAADDASPLSDQPGQAPQQLQQLEAVLQQAGLIRRTAHGLRLTPRGARQIAAGALREVFDVLRRDGRGQQTAARRGHPGPPTGETKAYEFGDPFDVHVGQTLVNALLRQPCLPLRLAPQDFAVQRREPLTHNATVIMLDMSASMELFGRNRFTAAKKMVLALAQLIKAHFPRDALHIVGFGDTARQIQVHDLPYVTVGREHTNTQAGLRLARTLLGRQRLVQKHILLITDGRPTAIERDGQLQRHTRGLHPMILEETYKEAKRCREQDITLNTFMVADEAALVQFVRRLTEISQGRALYTTPERLGHYVIEDYIRRR